MGKKRLSFKERKEQTLLETLDNIHGTAEAMSSKDKSRNNKPSKQANNSKQQTLNKSPSKSSSSNSNSNSNSNSGSKSSGNQWPHMQESNNKSKSSASKGRKKQTKKDSKPKSKVADKTVAYIDGENTFFQLYDQLRKTRKVKYREDLVKYDMRWLIEKALNQELGDAEMRYYGVRLKEIDSTPEMLERTKRMIDHKNRWSGYLASQNFEYIAAGELKIRATENYNGTGKTNLTFEEKGVDVQMAVEMVDDAASGKVEHALLLSSDRDLQPAIQAAQKHGVKVTYVAHDRRANDSIVGVVDSTETFTSRDITEGFKRAN